ncbi:MAG: hypothetical protein ACT4N8_06375, partial [Sphingosinicella sp.]|uniref:hypothetical protein n=1 Tax=Sphingosinicella sp. TaxID=1917971 RepID=UPI0040379AD4
APESLLPEGFGDPQNLPPPENKAATRAAPTPAPSVTPLPEEDGEEDEELDPLAGPRPTNYFAIPPGTVRPVDVVGVLEPGNHGLGADAFGRTGGAYLAELMRRLDAPLPSRWTSILLRRALLSRLAAPSGVHPVDWVAERADLLLRMGEADAARMLVQSVDQPNYTPRMVEVAARTALANADIAGLCPLAGASRSREAAWVLSEAMCAALESEPARASALIDQARGAGATGIDLSLAEKVVGAGGEARRSAALVWDNVGELNAWRFGLASATGAEIPAPLMARAGPQMQAWFARAPMLAPEQRADAAAVAASLGVFSSQSFVELHSLILDRADPTEITGSVGARLRAAWTGGSVNERLEALRTLWSEPEAPRLRYARLVLTAGAAARVEPAAEHAADSANLVAAMLSAGLDRRAARWAGLVQEAGEQQAWAMLAVGAPASAVDVGVSRVEDYVGAAGGRRAQLLVAALIGLGRVSDSDAPGLARSAGFELGGSDRWSDALERAVRERQPGRVALLAAVGMQTGDWSGVPPHYLLRIVRALREVGMDYEARMIAAEAVARL